MNAEARAAYWQARYDELVLRLKNVGLVGEQLGVSFDSPEPPVGAEITMRGHTTPEFVHQPSGWWCARGYCTDCPCTWEQVTAQLTSPHMYEVRMPALTKETHD